MRLLVLKTYANSVIFPSVVARIMGVLPEKFHNFRSWGRWAAVPLASPARMPMFTKRKPWTASGSKTTAVM